MTFKTATLIITAIINISIGVLVFLKNTKRRNYRYFLGITIGIFVWAVSSIINHISKDYNIALNSTRISFLGGIILVNYFILFALNFPEEKGMKKINTAIVFFPNIILSIVTIFTPLIIESISLSSLNVTEKGFPGKAFLYYVIQLILYIITSLFILIKKYKKYNGRYRYQILYLFLGAGISSIVGIVASFILPFIFKQPYYASLGSTSTIFLISFIAYSIIKYRFMDIRLTIRKYLIRLIMTFLFSLIFILILFIFSLIMDYELNWGLSLIVIFLSSVIGIIIFEPIERTSRQFLSHLFFQREENKEEVVKILGQNIQESIDLTTLIKKLEEAITQIFNPQFVNFCILGNEVKETELCREMRVVLKNYNEIMIRDEIEEIISENERMKKEEKEILSDALKLMNENHIQVVVPLAGQKEIIGYIFWGGKKFNEAYTTNDISTLNTIRYQAGIAIDNASLYNEVQTFSKKMKREVVKATNELQGKNKFLNVLRRVDQIIMNNFEIEEVCQKIVDTVAWEMGYTGALIALINHKQKVLEAFALSNTPEFKKIDKFLPKKLTNISVDLENKNSLLSKAIRKNEVIETESLLNIYSPPLKKEECEQIDKLLKIKKHFIFPISAKGKVLGTIVIGIDRKEIKKEEEELMKAFVEEVGIAVENATLYSQLKNMNNDLVQANKELKKLDKMKDEFVSVASHELRTPMTAIRGYAWMLEKSKHSAKLDQRQTEYLQKITISTERLITLVNDILDVSKIEGGKIQMNIKNNDIEDLIKETINEIKPRAIEKNIILYYEEGKREIENVLIDRDRIYEVLINLIGNAIKFTPEAGKIKLSIKERGKMVEVSVTDTGRGIPKKDIPKLFKKFGRLDHSFALISETTGTGLGLYISKSYLDMHGGKIWVSSKLGEGSTFTFSVRKVQTENREEIISQS